MNRRGSAILVVIGTITVLIILAIAFLGSSKEKAGISKNLSDEKKVEALAESATELVLAYIKKNANKHENSDGDIAPIYYLLRAPMQPLEGAGSENFALDSSKAKPVEDLDSLVHYSTTLNDSIKNIGWEGKVDITSKCEISHAEAFTPANSNYKVPNIDVNHLPAIGNSAKFYDDGSTCGENSTDWQTSNWEIRFKFPKGDPNDEEKEFEVEVEGIIIEFDKKIVIKLHRDNEISMEFEVKVDTKSLFGEITLKDSPYKVDDIINNAPYFETINPKTMQGIKQSTTIGDSNYSFNSYVESIKERKSEVADKLAAYNEGFNLDSTDLSNPYYVEKGGILRITTDVTYKKSENHNITKKLVAEIPFKTSDVQPIAPEYTFFVANTRNVGSVLSRDSHLGQPLDMNNGNPGGSVSTTMARNAIGHFILHNVPMEGNKPNFNNLKDGVHIPGMVRINTDYSAPSGEVTKVRSFLGTFDHPEYTELNKFLTPFDESFSNNKFNTRVSFYWDDMSPSRYHEIEFPILFETKKVGEHLDEHGIKNCLKIFEQGNYSIVSVPTLLSGIAHMEHPLGLCVEGPIDTIYSRLRGSAKPEADVDMYSHDVDDKTEVYFDYDTVSTFSKGGETVYDFSSDGNDRMAYEPTPYGMLNHPGYTVSQSWNSSGSGRYEYNPGNCYDALQYAKKATRFYETGGDFIKDLGRGIDDGGLSNGSAKELNGVFYIKSGDLNLTGGLTYKGNGLIVCKEGTISLGAVKRSDSTSTLGIIARGGNIEFKSQQVEAACFSNCAPCGKGNMQLHGNLVCNDYIRDKFTQAEVFYDNTLTTVTPFASLRKVGKFEPKRYCVSFDYNWSRFAYEKNDNEN